MGSEMCIRDRKLDLDTHERTALAFNDQVDLVVAVLGAEVEHTGRFCFTIRRGSALPFAWYLLYPSHGVYFTN